MPASAQRILTTHAGRLPRPPDLLQMMYDRGVSKAVDEAAIEARTRAAVDEIVRKQREIGLDFVSDVEMSKTGFSTYLEAAAAAMQPEYESIHRTWRWRDTPAASEATSAICRSTSSRQSA